MKKFNNDPKASWETYARLRATPNTHKSKKEEGLLNNYKKVYQTLPLTIFNPSTVDDEEAEGEIEPKSDGNAPKNIQEFVSAVAAASGKRSSNITPYFLLDKTKVKGKKTFANHKKTFSAVDKRRLGLHLLPKKGLKFEQFVPLHAMWKEYMMDFMNIDELKALGFQGLPSDSRWTEFSLQLMKADYHGAFLTVTRSRCPGNVGSSGIVVTDTKNTFNLIGRDDTVRTIPKDTSVFSLTLDDFKLTLFGKYLCIRPAERSVKKIKSRMSADL